MPHIWQEEFISWLTCSYRVDCENSWLVQEILIWWIIHYINDKENHLIEGNWSISNASEVKLWPHVEKLCCPVSYICQQHTHLLSGIYTQVYNTTYYLIKCVSLMSCHHVVVLSPSSQFDLWWRHYNVKCMCMTLQPSLLLNLLPLLHEISLSSHF